MGNEFMTGNRKAPGRLLILRPDHLGDLLLFSGALRLIRARWPATHITLCVRSYGLELFSACPHIDRLYSYEQLRSASPINRIPQFPGSRHVRQALQECFGGWLRTHAPAQFLSSLECDLAVLPMRSPEAEFHWLLRMIPASVRLGVSGNTGNQTPRAARITRRLYSEQLDISGLPSNYPELDMTRDFLRFMGLETEPADVWPEFWTREADRKAAEKLFAGLGTTRRVLGITPGASASAEGSKKMLPASWYADVLREMAGGESLDIVLLGSRQDMAICAELDPCSAERVASLNPRWCGISSSARPGCRSAIEPRFLLSESPGSPALLIPSIASRQSAFYPMSVRDPVLIRPLLLARRRAVRRSRCEFWLRIRPRSDLAP